MEKFETKTIGALETGNRKSIIVNCISQFSILRPCLNTVRKSERAIRKWIGWATFITAIMPLILKLVG